MRKSILLLAAAAAGVHAGRGPAAALPQSAGCRRSAARHARAGRRSSAAPRPARARPMSQPVGRRVGAQSGLANPGQALHFTTLNSAVENAFSVPGGYVYVTRQLMTLDGR